MLAKLCWGDVRVDGARGGWIETISRLGGGSVTVVKPLPASPLVSVVTPSFNQAAYIEETIRSVREQEYPRIEHVVVDGGSTDGTPEILAAHAELRWLSEPDDGQADALAKGFRLAGGDVLAWLNSDDLYLPGTVSKAVEALQSSGAAMVYANMVEIDATGHEVGRQKARRFNLDRLLNIGNSIPQPTVFLRRDAFEAVGGIDRRYHFAMDYDLWIRVGRRFPVHYVDDFWACFRLHEESKTVAREREFWREVREISRRHGGRLLFSDLALTCIHTDHRLLGSLLWRARGLYRSYTGSTAARSERGL